MRRRKTTRFHFPNIKLPWIDRLLAGLPKAKPPKARQSKVDLPEKDSPRREFPRLKLPKFTIPVRQILVVAIMAILVLTMMNLNTRLTDYYRLTSDRNTIQGEVAQLEVTRQVLQTQLAYAQSNNAVEEFARNSHMIREGEKLVVVLTAQGNVVATPENPIPTPKSVENWEVWWALFFGN
jgi:cell division protein FtsB